MGIIDSLVKRFLEQGIILSKKKISNNAYHIKIQSDNIKSVDFLPGYFLRLGIGFGNEEISLKDKVRSYSVWEIDKTKGTIDIAIATYSNGIGTSWIKKCKEGDSVSFVWKKGNFIIDHTADSYLMIGDLSALSHLYIINRNLDKSKQVESILYSQNKYDLYQDIDGKLPFDFYELTQNPFIEIINKINLLLPKMNGNKIVYIAGDSRLCVALNNYFKKELNWDTKQIKIKPFWNPEKKGLE